VCVVIDQDIIKAVHICIIARLCRLCIIIDRLICCFHYQEDSTYSMRSIHTPTLVPNIQDDTVGISIDLQGGGGGFSTTVVAENLHSIENLYSSLGSIVDPTIWSTADDDGECDIVIVFGFTIGMTASLSLVIRSNSSSARSPESLSTI